MAGAVRTAFMDGLTAATGVAAAILAVAGLGALLRAPRRLDSTAPSADTEEHRVAETAE